QPNPLYQNNGDGTFTDVAAVVGVPGLGNSVAAAWGDYDNDGDLDLYLCKYYFQNSFYRNNGNGTFSEVAASSGIADVRDSEDAAWGDYDDDGFVDLYIARGENWNDGNSLYYSNQLYRNNGDGTFSNATLEAGVDESDHKSYSRGVIWGDYNNDGWLDLYVANYRQQLNYLYHNNGNGTFTDVAAEKNV
ncbi:MAG: VCBS repeat-containing protein, partial [Lentisphaeria bacterium]|nr:VCBS repeat-containing protein [Lentisphaeria bacterium]